MQYLLGFILGLGVGFLLAFIALNRLYKKDVKEAFSALSLDALNRNTEAFYRLANEKLAGQAQLGSVELEGKKKLIDQALETMRVDLQRVERTFGDVSVQLKSTAEQTGKLQETTNKLQSALSVSRARGQWGERMAEDVLRAIGFVEGVNYQKQKTIESATSRPDYTFSVPPDLKLNMDVKFPLDNYMKYLGEENVPARESLKQQFLKDVRQRIREVTTRDYISPRDKTLDYVLVFIPSEQVYGFVHECDHTLLDEAMRNKVVLCSPLTLYAMLAVIRKSTENFNLSGTTQQMLSFMDEFKKQWEAYRESMGRMGKRIDETQKEFQSLTTTRTNQVERPLRQIEELRCRQGIETTPTPHLPDKPDSGEPG